jgi:hypothetical protein
VRVVFGENPAGKNYDIRVTSSTSDLTVTSGSLGESTAIELKGHNSGSTAVITTGTVEVYQNSRPTGAKLYVKVLPERKIKLGIFRVSDTTSTLSELYGFVPDNDRIIAKLNVIWKQAGIVFEQDPTIPSGGTKSDDGELPYVKLHIPFDNNKDGMLGNWGASNNQEWQVLRGKADTLPAKLNLLILRDLKAKSISGHRAAGVSTKGTRYVGVFTQSFEKYTEDASWDDFIEVCAHEIGHALGASTRNDAGAPPGHQNHHDGGPFPSKYGETFGLMHWRGGYGYPWIRWEDWEEANKNAENYYKAP